MAYWRNPNPARSPVVGAPSRRLFDAGCIPTWLDVCDDHTDWSAIGGACTLSNDTDNCMCGGANMQSVKATWTGAGTLMYFTRTFNPAKDLTDTHGVFRFYIHPGSGSADPENITSITFQMKSAGADYRNYRLYNRQPTLWSAAGWWEVPFTFNGEVTVGGGDLDISAMNQYTILVGFETTGGSVAITMDRILFRPKLATPYYALTFDDGVETHLAVARYLSSKNMAGTFYIVPTWVGTAGYLTLDELKEMRDAGHLIANHSWSHPPGIYPTLTDAEIVAEYLLAAAWMAKNGFSDGKRIIAVPYGRWKPSDKINVYAKVADQWRLVLCPGWRSVPLGVWDLSRIWCVGFDSASVGTTLLADAITDGAICITGWHGVGDGVHETLANFKTHVDAVATERDNGTIKVATVAELLDLDVS